MVTLHPGGGGVIVVGNSRATNAALPTSCTSVGSIAAAVFPWVTREWIDPSCGSCHPKETFAQRSRQGDAIGDINSQKDGNELVSSHAEEGKDRAITVFLQ
jgi:hypothetical protein